MTETTYTPYIFPVDIGFGYSKYLEETIVDGQQRFAQKSYPSYAIAAEMSTLALHNEFNNRVNVFPVLVHGQMYMVGEDIETLMPGKTHTRTMALDFNKSDKYAALVFGALYDQPKDYIDLLVLGLPVQTWAKDKEQLARRFTGSLRITADRTIHVANVLVAPQPMGGFYDYADQQRKYSELSKQRNLMIDLGYNTLDWLSTLGVKPIDARSDSVDKAGMGGVIRAIQKMVAKRLENSVWETDWNKVPEFRIESYIRSEGKEKSNIDGFDETQITWQDCIDAGVASPEQGINALLNSVGDEGEIDNIILFGGGLQFLKPAIEKAFPRKARGGRIGTMSHPGHSNVRGFKVIGALWCKARHQDLAEAYTDFANSAATA